MQDGKGRQLEVRLRNSLLFRKLDPTILHSFSIFMGSIFNEMLKCRSFRTPDDRGQERRKAPGGKKGRKRPVEIGGERPRKAMKLL